MSLSYNDLTLLRYIQKRQMIPLSKTALHFQKNESSIRRTIEQINLYSSEPMVRIEKSICYSCISYEDLVSFIRNLDQKDYLSSSDERIRVMITAIFFQNYVNSSKLYEQWGLSLTTKKQDTALLRQFLTRYGLELVTKKKKGLSIQGDELQLRFLVIDILHPLFEFTSENKVLARFANTPLEKQTYELATEYLSCSFQEATELSKCNDNSANTFLKHDICLMGKLSGIYGSRSITKQCHLRLVGNENICMFEDVLT